MHITVRQPIIAELLTNFIWFRAFSQQHQCPTNAPLRCTNKRLSHTSENTHYTISFFHNILRNLKNLIAQLPKFSVLCTQLGVIWKEVTVVVILPCSIRRHTSPTVIISPTKSSFQQGVELEQLVKHCTNTFRLLSAIKVNNCY